MREHQWENIRTTHPTNRTYSAAAGWKRFSGREADGWGRVLQLKPSVLTGIRVGKIVV
jgi:hypothetical protein